MQRVSFGIVGSGFMGQSHAKALAAIPDACVRWICGRDTDKVSELASQVGGQGTTDLEEVPLTRWSMLCWSAFPPACTKMWPSRLCGRERGCCARSLWR